MIGLVTTLRRKDGKFMVEGEFCRNDDLIRLVLEYDLLTKNLC